jgi:hypothetical protein
MCREKIIASFFSKSRLVATIVNAKWSAREYHNNALSHASQLTRYFLEVSQLLDHFSSKFFLFLH